MCPTGCKVRVKVEDDEAVEVLGNACPEGKEYAVQEVERPSRVVMSVIKDVNGDFPTVSVKTEQPVAKDKIEEVMDKISELKVEGPIDIGEVVLDMDDLGIKIVATRPSRIRS